MLKHQLLSQMRRRRDGCAGVGRRHSSSRSLKLSDFVSPPLDGLFRFVTDEGENVRKAQEIRDQQCSVAPTIGLLGRGPCFDRGPTRRRRSWTDSHSATAFSPLRLPKSLGIRTFRRRSSPASTTYRSNEDGDHWLTLGLYVASAERLLVTLEPETAEPGPDVQPLLSGRPQRVVAGRQSTANPSAARAPQSLDRGRMVRPLNV
jgi:hypothetical protein